MPRLIKTAPGLLPGLWPPHYIACSMSSEGWELAGECRQARPATVWGVKEDGGKRAPLLTKRPMGSASNGGRKVAIS